LPAPATPILFSLAPAILTLSLLTLVILIPSLPTLAILILSLLAPAILILSLPALATLTLSLLALAILTLSLPALATPTLSLLAPSILALFLPALLNTIYNLIGRQLPHNPDFININNLNISNAELEAEFKWETCFNKKLINSIFKV